MLIVYYSRCCLEYGSFGTWRHINGYPDTDVSIERCVFILEDKSVPKVTSKDEGTTFTVTCESDYPLTPLHIPEERYRYLNHYKRTACVMELL
jgi:hypothetical protein